MWFYLGFVLLAIFNDSLDKKKNMVFSNYGIVFLPQHVLVSLEPFVFVHIWVSKRVNSNLNWSQLAFNMTNHLAVLLKVAALAKCIKFLII